MLNIGYVSNETNTDVCMYTWRIYSIRDLDTLLHTWVAAGTELLYGKYTGFYTIATKDEKGENYSWMTIDSVGIIEVQWHEKVSIEWINVWSVIPLFGVLLTPVIVNGNLHWLDAHQTVEKSIECHSCN